MRSISIVVVRDDGKGDANPTIRFGASGAGWRIVHEGLEGFEGIDYEVSTGDYAQYDGSYLLAERSPTRDRTISAVRFGDPAELRRQAESFFIPKREYEVHVTADGRSRFVRARQYAFSLKVDCQTGGQLLDWTFLSLDPYWMSEDSKTFDIAEARRKFGFPFVSFAQRRAPEPEARAEGAGDRGKHVEGFVVGVLSKRVSMVNAGGAEAYPVFVMTATDRVVNPRVTVEDESGGVVCEIGFDLEMSAGDAVTVDFSQRPTSITLNGANVSQLTTAGSTLAAGIGVGTFSLSWSAESGDAALSVVPTIRERYATI